MKTWKRAPKNSTITGEIRKPYTNPYASDLHWVWSGVICSVPVPSCDNDTLLTCVVSKTGKTYFRQFHKILCSEQNEHIDRDIIRFHIRNFPGNSIFLIMSSTVMTHDLDRTPHFCEYLFLITYEVLLCVFQGLITKKLSWLGSRVPNVTHHRICHSIVLVNQIKQKTVCAKQTRRYSQWE